MIPLRARFLAAALTLPAVAAACSDDSPTHVDSIMITQTDLPGDLQIQPRVIEPGTEACEGVLDLASAWPGEVSTAADIVGSHAFFVEAHRHEDVDAARTAFSAAGTIADRCTGNVALEPDGSTTRFTIERVSLPLDLPDGSEADVRHHVIANAFVVELDVITIRVDEVVAVAGGTDRATTISLIELMADRAAGRPEGAVVAPDGFYEAVPSDDLDHQLGEADATTLFRLAATGIPRLTPETEAWVTSASEAEIEALGALACEVVEAAGDDVGAQDEALLEAWEQLPTEERGRLDPGSFGQLAATALVVYCPEVAVNVSG